MNSFFDHFRSRGRYRFRCGRSLDPNEGLHPELAEDGIEVGNGVPNTIDELMAMQRHEASNPNLRGVLPRIPDARRSGGAAGSRRLPLHELADGELNHRLDLRTVL